MSRESFPSPEEKEAESRQARVDRAFELAALSRFSEKFFDEDLDSDVFAASEALLVEPVEKHFGEPYKLSGQGDRCTLAQRLRINTTWDFDPLASLAIKWDKEVDLPSGQVKIDYDVYAKAEESDGWDERLYTEPKLEDQHLQATASPEAVKRVYERLEREFAAEVEKYEAEAAKYEKADAWVRKNAGRKFQPGEPVPDADAIEEFSSDRMVWSADFDSSQGETVAICYYDGGVLHDIRHFPKPTPPARRYPPMAEREEK